MKKVVIAGIIVGAAGAAATHMIASGGYRILTL